MNWLITGCNPGCCPIEKSRSRKSGGTGLGLAIAKEIVESHGGTMEAKSKLGIGSSFVITLPRGEKH